MNVFASVAALVLGTASLGFAGLGDALVVGTFSTPAADSTAVKTIYGAAATSNPASSRALSVGSDGALTLTTSLGLDAEPFSARAGILCP